MSTIQTFVANNWQWILAGVVSAVLNTLSRKKTADEWEAWALRQPALALVAEIVRAVGADPKKVLIAIKRYADRRVGVIPADIWTSLPVSPGLQSALRDPAKRAQIENLFVEIRAEEAPRPTLTPPPAA